MPMYLSDCSPRFSWLQLTPGEPSVCKCTTRYTGGVHTQHTVCGVCTHSTHCVVYVLPPLYLVSVRNDTHHWVPGVHTTRYPVSITTRQAPPHWGTGVPVPQYYPGYRGITPGTQYIPPPLGTRGTGYPVLTLGTGGCIHPGTQCICNHHYWGGTP